MYDYPYTEGVDARLSGKNETANPYDPDTEERAYGQWFDGWCSIEDEDIG